MTASSSKNAFLIVLSLTVIGFALRFCFALTVPLGWDGGIFLYWANLINGGAIPYRDFFIRDPLYIYLLALSVRFLGPTYFAASLVSIIPGAATIPMIFKTCREIFDRGSGFVAALAYAVSPTVIWYSTVIDERTLMLFLSICALWMLMRGLKRQESRYFIAYGLTL